MKIFISEEHRQNARSVALRNIAKFFEIPDWDLKNNDQLYNDISSLTTIKNAVIIFNLLKDYFKAYDDWFDFYQVLKKQEQKANKEIFLNDKQKIQLSGLVEKREVALNTLQEKFDELQLTNFNKKTFGRNIF